MNLTGLTAAAALMGSAATATETLTAVHAFPTTLVYTRSFLKYAEAVNTRGAGVIEIDVRGGPEAIGIFRQADAVRDGLVGMVCTPGVLPCRRPAGDAPVTSNRVAAEVRENGGIDLINEIHEARTGGLLSRLVRQRRVLQPLDRERAAARRRGQPGDDRRAAARQPGLQRLLHRLSGRAGDRPAPPARSMLRWNAASSTPPAGPGSGFWICAGTRSSTTASSRASSPPTSG